MARVGANVDRGCVTGASVGASVGTHAPPSLQTLNGEFGTHTGIMPVRHIWPWHIPRVQPLWHAVLSEMPWQLSTGSVNGVAVVVTGGASAHSPPLAQLTLSGYSSHRCRSVGKQVPAMQTPRLQPEKHVRIESAVAHDSTGSLEIVEVEEVEVVVVVVVVVVVEEEVEVSPSSVVTVVVVDVEEVEVAVVTVVLDDVTVVSVEVEVVDELVSMVVVVVDVVGTVVAVVVVDEVVHTLHDPHAPGQNKSLMTGVAQLGSLGLDGQLLWSAVEQHSHFTHVPHPTWHNILMKGLPHCTSSADVGHAGWSSMSSVQHFAVGTAAVLSATVVSSAAVVTLAAGASVGAPVSTTSAVVVVAGAIVEGADVFVGFVLSGFFG